MKEKIDFRKNASGYTDPTFFEAMQNLDAESDQVRKLIKYIKHLCDKEGFSIDNRIALKSNRTGKVYK